MQTLIAVMICISPALFVGLGYYLGRYGSPIAIKLQARRDRRRPQVEGPADEDSDSVEVYHADDRPRLQHMPND